MFADPAVVAINGSNKSLVRINQDGYSSEYLLRSATNEYRLKIRNSSRVVKGTGKVIERHSADLTETVFPVAPATASTLRKVYVVIENEQGDTLVDPVYNAAGLLAFLTASSSANITKMLNSES